MIKSANSATAIDADTAVAAPLPRVAPIRAFRDNYIWALIAGSHVAVVDPGDAAPVLAWLRAENLELTAILLTHHHADHVGGVADLLASRMVPVFGPRSENIPLVAHALGEGDAIEVPGIAVRFRVFDIPGHTRGHIAYYGANSLFCGDTLFTCGCGRLFEGTPTQMLESLTKLAALPDETHVYCGHEYTMANIAFALAVEPGNAALMQRAADDQAKRDENLPTVPSRLAEERATNPFLRAAHPAVAAAAAAHAGHALPRTVDVFAALREWKNTF